MSQLKSLLRSPSRNNDQAIAHPLLGASTSSLNLAIESGSNGSEGLSTSLQIPTLSPKASSTFSTNNTDSLPYKPRQRHAHQNSTGSIAGGGVSPGLAASVGNIIPTAPPTTSTSSTFALPPSATDPTDASKLADSQQASATARLQVQSLKASAQRMGLDNGSMGMAMIDAIVDKGQLARHGSKAGEGGEWGDIFRLLTCGKAVLLLPLSASSSLSITSQVIRDHIAFLSPPIPLRSVSMPRSRSPGTLVEKGKDVAIETVTMAVTLTGIIGRIQGDNIHIESMLCPDAPLLSAIRDPISRPHILAALRPTTLAKDKSLPTYTLSSLSPPLAFPPLGKSINGTSDSKDNHKEAAKSATSKIGRMNPFASFFGSPASSSTPQAASSPQSSTQEPPALQSSAQPPSSGSPKPSSLSINIDDAASILSQGGYKDVEGYSVSAYTVSKPIRVSEVHKSLSKAVRQLIKEDLSRLPERVIDRVIRLVQASICSSTTGLSEVSKSNPIDTSNIPIIDFADPAKASGQLQDFLESIYDELFDYFRNDSSYFVAEAGLKRKGSGGKPWSRTSFSSEKTQQDAGGSKEAKDRRRREREERAETEGTAGTERVEAVIMRFLYNRLFSPLGSDDSRHDEALSSRIAALNMLDLSLDHLGLITRPEDEGVPGTIASGLSTIVDDIGDELQRLITPDCLTPKAKVDVLIRAHQLVVDGLAQMPPVNLRPEGEPYISPATPPDVPAADNEHSLPTDLATVAVTPSQGSSSPLHNTTQSPPISPPGQEPSKTADNERELPASSQASESSQLEEAMGDSVLTLQADNSVPRSSPATHDTHPGTSTTKTTAAAPAKTSTSGADLILPIIIFAVVRANPPQLASQLMYLRRYRSAICLTGEASYAMVNLTAVIEFLEHVDLAELGLGGESDKVMSVADLSPIGLGFLDERSEEAQSIASASSRLRGRVFQVGELAGTAAGSANKVITGVIDSSWSAVRGLISTATPALVTEESGESTLPQSARPDLGARQPSTFSLASVTASVANIAAAAAATTAAARSRASSTTADKAPAYQWQGNQEMIDVTSRPVSIKEEVDKDEYPSDSDSATSVHEDHLNDKTDPFASSSTAMDRNRALSDARSIRSVSSMMSKEGRKEDAGRSTIAERVSLSDRLANIGGFGKSAAGGSAEISHNPSPEKEAVPPKATGFLASLAASRSASSTGQNHGRRGSLLSGVPDIVGRLRSDSNPSPSARSSAHTPSIIQDVAPPQPIERFMTCDLGDIQLSELGELLRDYRRLGEYVTGLNKGAPAAAGLSPSVSNGT